MRKAKQSTAKNVMVLMVQAADHVTGLAGLTLTITASKDGGAFASIAPTVTDRGSGWYSIALDAGMLDTLGDLALHITGASADPADMVILVEGGATDADVTSRMATYTQPTGFLTATFPSTVASTTNITAGTITTTTNLTNLPAITADWITAAGIAADAGTELATAVWASGTRTLTASLDPTAATIAAAVWDRDATGHQTQGTFGQAIGDPGADTDTIWSLANTNLDAAISTRMATFTLPANFSLLTIDGSGVADADVRQWVGTTPNALISGRVDATVGAMQADTLTAAALAGDAVTEIQAGLSTLTAAGVRTAVGLAAANLDTQLADLPTAAEIVAAQLTTAITEAYRANGAAPTLAQFMSEVLAHLGESSISGTTKTVNRFDHSTAAATFTLDDASSPTSVTRAT